MRSLLISALAGGAVVVSGAVGMAMSAPPASQSPAALVPAEDAEAGAGPGAHGKHASPRGRANRAAAREFVEAKKVWVACVAESAPEHEEPGRFDPQEACGEKPRPAAQLRAHAKKDEGARGDDRRGRPTDHPGKGNGRDKFEDKAKAKDKSPKPR